MKTEGIEGVYLETHNWGRSARFFQALGFEVAFETDHGSGLLRNGGGPYLFLAEVPEDQALQTHLVLTVADADAYQPPPEAELLTPFEDTHYRTRELTLRDPDGRVWRIQAPQKP